MVSLERNNLTPKKNTTANKMHGIILSLLMLILSAFLSGCCSQRPLNQAAWNNDIEQMKTLIDGGASIDKKSAGQVGAACSATPLDSAVVQGHIEAVEFLLESGADVNLSRYCAVTNESGFYPFKGSVLMVSSLKGDLKISEILLKAGADINQRTENHLWTMDNLEGYDSLEFSADMGNSDIARLLIKYGADVNAKDENGKKAVYTALVKGNTDYVIDLLGNGLEIDSDLQWMHYNAEIAHIAADHYASLDEEKAIQFYKKAIEFYPQGTKNYQSIANGYKQKEYAKAALSVAAVVFGAYGAQTQANIMAQNTGYGVATYNTRLYNPNMSGAERNQLKAQTSEINYNICNAILNCYEKLEANMTLADCAENAQSAYNNQKLKEDEELNGATKN